MNYELKSEEKEMPTNETNETKRREEQLWIMNYKLWIEKKERKREKRRDKEEHAHELNEWNEEERKAIMNYELWVMSYELRAVKSEG